MDNRVTDNRIRKQVLEELLEEAKASAVEAFDQEEFYAGRGWRRTCEWLCDKLSKIPAYIPPESI